MNKRYLAERIGHSVLVFFIVLTITFALYRFMPGGPIEILRAQIIANSETAQAAEGQLERVDRLVEQYSGIRPDEPWYIAYVDYLEGIILHQDFGQSIHKDGGVYELLFSKMPWSLFISIYGLALGTTVSLVLGAFMAHYEGTRFDTGLTVFTIINQAIPYFIFAIILLIIFSFNLDWLPSRGRYAFAEVEPGVNIDFMVSVIKHAILPISAAFLAGFGGGLGFRGNAVREKGETYTRIARVRGIKESRIAIRYIGRNSLLPIYTRLMLGIAGVFSSSIILEKIFQYRGVGLLMFEALKLRDYPLLMGGFMFFTAMTLLGIVIADMTYGIIDPRVVGGGDRESF
jgi:peptide/nickel transport system permease protein